MTRLIGIPGVQRIRSRATAGRAVVWVDYALGTNVFKARQVTAGGLQLADPALPETVDLMLGPVLVPDQVMLVALSGRRPISELREVADRVVRPRLLTMPGVAEVVVTGGQVMQCRVIVSPDRMKAYSLTICELVSAVEQALDGDSVEPGTQEHVVREMGRLHVSSTLGEVVLMSPADRPIRLKDVAQIQLGAAPPHRDPSRPEDEAESPRPAVLLGVLRLREFDAERLSQELDRVLDKTRAMLPPDLSLSRRLSSALAPLVSQMADEIQQDQPPGFALQQQTSADHGMVLVRKSPPRAGVAIVGPERAQLCRAGRDLADQLRAVPGVTDVQADSLEEAPQKRFNVDRERAANLGVATSDILTTVDVAQRGRRVGRLEEPGDGPAFGVVVSLVPEVQDDAETLQGLLLRTASGEAVALGQLVTVEAVSVPRSLYRQQMLPAIVISCEVRAGDRAPVMADIKRTVAAYPLPPGYHVEWE